MNKRLSGDFWAVVSASATGFGYIAAKTAIASLSPLVFNAHMFSLGAVVILADAVISGKLSSTIKCGLWQLRFYLLISIIFCGATLCFFSALALAEPATVSFLSRLELVSTLIFAAIFLKEKIVKAELWGLLLVGAGIFVMRYGAPLDLSQAVMLVSIGSVLFGTAEVLTKNHIEKIDYRAFMFYRNLFMGVIFTTVGLISGKFVLASGLKLWLLLIISAILLPYLGRLGYLKAMQRINISRASIIVQSQPFFAAIAALIILGTLPPLQEIIGGLLIVAGVVFIKILEKRANRRLTPIGPIK